MRHEYAVWQSCSVAADCGAATDWGADAACLQYECSGIGRCEPKYTDNVSCSASPGGVCLRGHCVPAVRELTIDNCDFQPHAGPAWDANFPNYRRHLAVKCTGAARSCEVSTSTFGGGLLSPPVFSSDAVTKWTWRFVGNPCAAARWMGKLPDDPAQRIVFNAWMQHSVSMLLGMRVNGVTAPTYVTASPQPVFSFLDDTSSVVSDAPPSDPVAVTVGSCAEASFQGNPAAFKYAWDPRAVYLVDCKGMLAPAIGGGALRLSSSYLTACPEAKAYGCTSFHWSSDVCVAAFSRGLNLNYPFKVRVQSRGARQSTWPSCTNEYGYSTARLPTYSPVWDDASAVVTESPETSFGLLVEPGNHRCSALRCVPIPASVKPQCHFQE